MYWLNKTPDWKERSSELKLRLIGIEREATQRKLKSIRNYADELEDELTGMKGVEILLESVIESINRATSIRYNSVEVMFNMLYK